jgi:hypothetical protein
MRRFLTFILATALPIGTLAQSPETSAAKDQIITIDGSKNPELIPQWQAWGYTFRAITRSADYTVGRGGTEEESIPWDIYRVSSKEDRATLLKEARDAVAAQNACETRGLKAREQGAAQKPEVLFARLNDMVIECRRITLNARDHLLAGLTPAAQSGIRQFVEARKQGMTVTMKKSELASFRLPE